MFGRKKKEIKREPKGSTDGARKILDDALKMWRDISPVCTAEVPEGDEWNTVLMWRGFSMATLTLGVKEVAITYNREINPPTIRLTGVSMLDEERGQQKYGKFCGEVAYLELLVRTWPTVLTDSAGNLRLMVDKGEYGRIEVTTSEIKYCKVVKYSDRTRSGTWAYTDLRNLMKYTLSITGQIDQIDDRKTGRELDSLMEL